MEPTARAPHRAREGASPSLSGPGRTRRWLALLALAAMSCAGDAVEPPADGPVPLAVATFDRSAALYAERCASCHDDPGWPDAATAPADVFTVLTDGADAHRDHGFDALAQGERWGLAFVTLARRHDEADAERGRTIADRLDPARVTPASLASVDDASLERRLASVELGTERRDLGAYMRRVAPFADRGPMATTRDSLAGVLSRYRRGEHLEARHLASRAHLADFAAAALPLRLVAPGREREVDAAFVDLRAKLASSASARDIEARATDIARDLYAVDRALLRSPTSSITSARAAGVAFAAFADGLLVLVLLLAIARRRGASPSEIAAVRAGLAAGLAAAVAIAATWSAGASAIAGAPVVAIDAAVAAAMLLAIVASLPPTVDHFFARRGSPPPAPSWLALLAGAAALLIVRDAVALVPSLRVLAAPHGMAPVLGGVALALAVAGAALVAVVEIGRRLGGDLRLAGFAIVATAAAVVCAGRAVLALQSLGVLPSTALGAARAPSFGVAGTVETTIAQGAAALAVAAALAWSGRRGTSYDDGAAAS